MSSNLRVDSIVPATGTNVSIGTATGGVNIPGVLTYEDVTNVDSVGVITARSGIDAASNLLLKTGGTEKVRIDSGGRILKGIQTARGNYANNASGVQFGVQIEATSGTDSTLSLIRSSNDANDGGIFIGKTRGSVGGSTAVQAGDDLGTITFGGADGTSLQFGAQIIAEVQSGVGNDDMPTDLIFKTNGGSTSTAERLRISSEGYLTMPNRPMFSGRPNISNAFRNSTETMKLTSHINVGNHWDNGNYSFTCPVTGYYFMQCNFISNIESYLFLRKNTGSGFTKIYTSSHGYGRGDSGEYRTIAGNHIESCNAGDKLDFYVQGGYYGLEHGSGTIFLLA